MIEIKINGKTCSCEKGEFLLDIAKRNGIYIPTLCHHPGIKEQGCCRVCLSEVVERGKSKIVVSCVYPIENTCEVFTNSDKVKEDRAVVLMLLCKRAPASKKILDMCQEFNAISGERFKAIEKEKCIMCGLCVRACSSIGSGAIATVLRGTSKKVSTPYDEPSNECIGCLSCANVCPTNAIDFIDDYEIRSIWGRDFKLVHCKECNSVIGTREEIEMSARKCDEQPHNICPDCRKKKVTDVLAKTYGL